MGEGIPGQSKAAGGLRAGSQISLGFEPGGGGGA